MIQDVETRPAKPPPPASWASLPNKPQLAIICSIRIADFFQQAALQAYMYYQLKSFDPTAPDSEISFQTGVLQGVFTAAQIFTAIVWGRIADKHWAGRKRVIVIGLVGQGLSCVGVGFATSFTSAVVWRCLGGAVNATVGGARTVLAEATDRKYHSRTFILLGLAFNIANIFGPIFGGLLADPVANYPGLFGPGSLFGGSTGVGWLTAFPYAAPNLMCAGVLFADALLVWLGLRETLVTRKYLRDRGIEIGDQIRYFVGRVLFNRFGYAQLRQTELSSGPDTMEDEDSNHMISLEPKEPYEPSKSPKIEEPKRAPPFYHAFSRNVILVLMTIALFDFQMGGFASLWIIFLSSPRHSPTTDPPISLPFSFTGGLGFPTPTIGFAMSILGFLGIILQLTLYPRVNARYGLLRSTRISLFVFPLAYLLAPYLSLLTSNTLVLWIGIFLVLLLQVSARTFALTGVLLLANNSSPSPALLGTVHGMVAATSSAFRTIGPIATGHWYAQSLTMGKVGWAWWLLALMSALDVIPALWAKDGSH